MAGAPSEEYHRGEMDIHEQARTYHSFLILSKWGSLAIITGVLFFTLLFCTKTGFIGSAISAIVVVVLGILLLRAKKNDAH
jgi:membrane protein implicated in regulation of membrane protease activity